MIPFCIDYIFVFIWFWYQMIPKVNTPLSCITCHTQGGAVSSQMKGFQSILRIFHIFFSVSCDTEAVIAFSFDTKRIFLFTYDTGSKLTCDSVFFSRVVFLGRKQRYVGSDSICRWSCITVGSDSIIWQAMQDKGVSTKCSNCPYYRNLCVETAEFLWRAVSTKIEGVFVAKFGISGIMWYQNQLNTKI